MQKIVDLDDYFAAKAMQAMLINENLRDAYQKKAAGTDADAIVMMIQSAYLVADTMIAVKASRKETQKAKEV